VIPSVAVTRHRFRIGHIPEDRMGEGLIPMHSVPDNAGTTLLRRLASRAGFLPRRRIETAARPATTRREVKTPNLDQTIGKLSRGDQQKVSVAKWLAAGGDVLIVDEPPIGIDIKTKVDLHQLLRDLSDQGTVILLIKSDMPEMISLADRVAVMHGFQITGVSPDNRGSA
jgi:ribose transport system ATP-binding protein